MPPGLCSHKNLCTYSFPTDNQFPIDIGTAAQDHPLLERDVLNSLFRRLQILNKCARLHQQRITHTDDSEDEQCALSDNWTYQSELRRWSRNCQNIQIRKSTFGFVLRHSQQLSCLFRDLKPGQTQKAQLL